MVSVANMADFTIEMSEIPMGYSFRRSDGQQFFMIIRDGGSAALYAGTYTDKPPAEGNVHFGVSVLDKVAAARPHILAYKTKPNSLKPSKG